MSAKINVQYQFSDDGSLIQVSVGTSDGSPITVQDIIDGLASTMEDLADFEFYPVSDEQLREDTELN